MENISRKSFLKGILVGLAMWSLRAGIGFAVLATGCSSETIAQAIIASFGKILQLLESSGILVNSQLVAGITAALNAFSDAYNAYEANKSSGNLTALEDAASAALADIQKFLAATSIGGPIAQVVVDLLEVILSELESFAPASASVTMKVGAIAKPVAAVKRPVKQYIAAFNAVAVADKHPELQIQ
jgi:hypothetical protein